METVVLLLVVCLSLYVRSAPNELEMVWLKDVTTSLQTVKREYSDPNLPDNLTFQLRRGSRALTLNLRRNHDIDPNADVYFVRKSNDGQSHLEKALNLENEDVAYYQDRQNGAFMTVKCVRKSNGQCNRVINGNVLIEGRNYDLQPAKTDITSRALFDVPDLGTLYVLRDQINVQRNISVTDEDAIIVTDENVDQEVKRNPTGQRLFPFRDSTLSPRNRGSLHNRDNQKQVYYVEIAVMLDSGIWDFYSSLMQTNQAPVQPVEVVKKLRQFFSHIINGVNLRYKGINDPSIEISVTLRAFYIFQKFEDFKLVKSVVEHVPGNDRINVVQYMKDLSIWTCKNSNLSDHVMLFTKYDIYCDYPGEDLNGFANFDSVCDKYHKTSIIKTRDYLFTVLTAAHELGHNLGAFHDGEDDAIACSADDYFLMSPDDPYFSKTTRNSTNPWIFSNCSVESFKKALNNKTCLTNVGEFYDIKEWETFMTAMPGQVYTLNQQCEFANGQGSVFCGGMLNDICRFMECWDPVTKKCLPTFIGAARGSECGENMWCKEGLCVSKVSK